MFKDKGTLTKDEQILISRYAKDVQDQLSKSVLESKENQLSYSYDNWIENMEQGKEINFSQTRNASVIEIGKPNTAKIARALVQLADGISRQPLKAELEHDGRLKEFQQHPKGTRVKANGEIVTGS